MVKTVPRTEPVPRDPVKEIARAVVEQMHKDYWAYKNLKPGHKNYKLHVTDSMLHRFCRDCWVWDVLDVDPEAVERGIKSHEYQVTQGRHKE